MKELERVITESKVCQPLYRELEPLDGVVFVYILM
jgi:hypothetical protein